MILQYLKTLSMIFHDAPNALFRVSETSKVLSPVTIPLSIHGIFYLLVSALFLHAVQYYAFKPELCSAQKMAN